MEPMLCLVGKFFTASSPPSIEKTETSLRQRWDPSGDMTVSPIEDDIILFNFELEVDMKSVLRHTWHVDGVILVLKQWPSHLSLSDIDFSVSWFSVKVEGLPLCRYTDEESRRIGEILSDKPLGKVYLNSSKRDFYVRAEIDLKKPLNPGFFLDDDSFVQFKYKNLGSFCKSCGMIDHGSCGEIPKERPLTREVKTRVYGPWMNVAFSRVDFAVEFPEKISEREDDEETVPYEQFFIKLKVEVVYANEHKWGDKKLDRSLPVTDQEYRFRFPCSFLATALESDDQSQALMTLAREIDENVPLIGLKFNDKIEIVKRFVEYSKENKKSWSDRRWVPLRICANKTIWLTSVDFQTKLQEREDEEFHRTIEAKIAEMIRRRVENNENVLSVPLWKTSIQDLMSEIGVKETEIPFDLDKRAKGARSEAIRHGVRFFSGPIPAEETSVCRLERVKILGEDMDELEPCTICQEGMFLGEEATRMPCSHLFHRSCIEEWLQRGNQCPNCRFQLPSRAERIPHRDAISKKYQSLKRRNL